MADHSGWLVKKAVKSLWKDSWKKRWFTIRENLITYASKPGASPKAMLVLTPDTVVEATTEHGPKRSFELVVRDPAFTLFACGASAEDTKAWIAALGMAIDSTRPAPARDTHAEAAVMAQRMEELRLKEDIERRDAQERQRLAIEAVGPRKRNTGGAAAASASSASVSSDSATPEEARRLNRAKSIRRRMAKMETVQKQTSAPRSGEPAAADAGKTLFESAVSMAVEITQHVVAQGNNEAGQLGNGRTTAGGEAKPQRVAVLEGSRTPHLLAMGRDFAIAASSDAVFVWGNGASGQLGVAAGYSGALRPFPNPHLRDRKVRSIACGDSHAILADAMGQVFVMGTSANGALGLGTGTTRADTPQLVLAGVDAAAVRAGGNSSAVISTSGQLFRWGTNDSGVSGHLAANGTALWKPLRMEDGLVSGGVVDIAFAQTFSLILAADPSNGAFQRGWVHPQAGRRAPVGCQLLVCGAPGAAPEHFEAHREAFTSPHHTRAFTDRPVAQAIACGPEFGILLAEQSVFAVGFGIMARATTNPAEACAEHPFARANLQELEPTTAWEPERIPDLDLEDVEQLACGTSHSMALTRRGAVLGWGLNTTGVLGTGTCNDQQAPVLAVQVRGHKALAVACGGASSMCLVQQGSPRATSRSRQLASQVAKHIHTRVMLRRAQAPSAAGAVAVVAPAAAAASASTRRFSTGARATTGHTGGSTDQAVAELQEQIFDAVTASKAAAVPAAAPDSEERGGWRRYYDGATPYYQNITAGTTQWEAPEPFL